MAIEFKPQHTRALASLRRSNYAATLKEAVEIKLANSRRLYEAAGDADGQMKVAAIKEVLGFLFTDESVLG